MSLEKDEIRYVSSDYFDCGVRNSTCILGYAITNLANLQIDDALRRAEEVVINLKKLQNMRFGKKEVDN